MTETELKRKMLAQEITANEIEETMAYLADEYRRDMAEQEYEMRRTIGEEE